MTWSGGAAEYDERGRREEFTGATRNTIAVRLRVVRCPILARSAREGERYNFKRFGEMICPDRDWTLQTMSDQIETRSSQRPSSDPKRTCVPIYAS